MKKRVLLVVAAMSLLVAVGLTGCGGTTVADPNAASGAAAPVSYTHLDVYKRQM